MKILRRPVARVGVLIAVLAVLAGIALTANALMGSDGGSGKTDETAGSYTTSSSCGISGCQSSAGAWEPGVHPEGD